MPTPEAENKSQPPTALESALTLLDCGPMKGSDPNKWVSAAAAMVCYCKSREDVTEAAARIIAAEYRKALAVIEAIEERYMDGCDTYEDWKFMGSSASDYFAQQKNTPCHPQ